MTVSILVAAHNHERWVGECLDSALAAGPDQLLVHDDGSTDATYRLACAWAAEHPDAPVTVTTAPNQGVSAVLAGMLEQVTSSHVLTLASDDRLAPGALRVLEAAAGDGAAFGDARVIDADGAVVRPVFTPEPVRAAMTRDLRRALITDWAVAGPVMLARRELLAYDPELRVEDWDLYLRLAAAGRLRYVPEVVADYRVHGANASLDEATERARMAEAAGVARRRAADFGGRYRALLLAKAAYLTLVPGPLGRPLRAIRARV